MFAVQYTAGGIGLGTGGVPSLDLSTDPQSSPDRGNLIYEDRDEGGFSPSPGGVGVGGGGSHESPPHHSTKAGGHEKGDLLPSHYLMTCAYDMI